MFIIVFCPKKRRDKVMDSAKTFCLKSDKFPDILIQAFKSLRSRRDFADVTLACEDDNYSTPTVIQFLFLKMNNHNFVQASLAEFVSVWSAGGNTTLNFSTTEGRVNMVFNVSLGHPGSAFSLPPSSVR